MKLKFKITTLFVLLICSNVLAQKDTVEIYKDLKANISKLENSIDEIKSENEKLSHDYKNLYNKYNSLNSRFLNYQKEINLKLE